LPALTQFYGLRPIDLEDMTFGEIEEYLCQLAEYHEAMRKAASRSGR
jgi:hypothetical protein